MPTVLTLKGMPETIELENSWQEAIDALNGQVRNGQAFVASRTRDGDMIVFRIEDVAALRSKDIEDDEVHMI